MEYQQISLFEDHDFDQGVMIMVDAGPGTPIAVSASPCHAYSFTKKDRETISQAYSRAFPGLCVEEVMMRIMDYKE